MDRTAALRRYDAFVSAVKVAIDSADPIGLLRIGTPSDEYEPEVGSIVPRVAKAADLPEVHRIIYEEFGRWFGVDTAGPLSAYEAPAREIWRALLLFRREGRQD